MKGLSALAIAAAVAWLIFRYALPHTPERLPNVEPPEDERGEGWPW